MCTTSKAAEVAAINKTMIVPTRDDCEVLVLIDGIAAFIW